MLLACVSYSGCCLNRVNAGNIRLHVILCLCTAARKRPDFSQVGLYPRQTMGSHKRSTDRRIIRGKAVELDSGSKGKSALGHSRGDRVWPSM